MLLLHDGSRAADGPFVNVWKHVKSFLPGKVVIVPYLHHLLFFIIQNNLKYFTYSSHIWEFHFLFFTMSNFLFFYSFSLIRSLPCASMSHL